MWGPIGVPALDQVMASLSGLGIGSRSRVLDLGCGPAELLRRLSENLGASGLGVDTSRFALAEARRRVSGSPAHGRVELRLGDVHELDRRHDFDLVICIGPGWDTGGWTVLTEWAAGFAAPGALVLLGEGAWRTPPSRQMLERLEMGADDYLPTAEVEDAIRGGTVEPIWVHRASSDEWRTYETSYRGALDRFARQHLGDPIAPAAAERAGRGWARFELMHSVLDFVLVLGRRGPESNVIAG